MASMQWFRASLLSYQIQNPSILEGTKFDDLSEDICFKSIVLGWDEELHHSFYIQKRAACFQNWPNHQITNDPLRSVGGIEIKHWQDFQWEQLSVLLDWCLSKI